MTAAYSWTNENYDAWRKWFLRRDGFLIGTIRLSDLTWGTTRDVRLTSDDIAEIGLKMSQLEIDEARP